MTVAQARRLRCAVLLVVLVGGAAGSVALAAHKPVKPHKRGETFLVTRSLNLIAGGSVAVDARIELARGTGLTIAAQGPVVINGPGTAAAVGRSWPDGRCRLARETRPAPAAGRRGPVRID